MLDILKQAGILQSLKKATYIRQVSVWAGFLKDKEVLTRPLFTTEKQEKLQKVIDNVNEVFGDHTIRNGFLLYSDKLTTVPNGFLADRVERNELTKLYD